VDENREGWQEQKVLAEHTIPVSPYQLLASNNGCLIDCQKPKAFLLEQRHRINIGSDNPHTVHPLDDEEREIDFRGKKPSFAEKG
jgi:hypothetical protein